MEIPDITAEVSFDKGQDEAEHQVKLVCKRVLPGWSDLAVEDVKVSRISGGISNLLVKVEPPEPLRPVAVKVFGDKTELLIDREAEKHILLRLNQLGFGAKVLALFTNGRVEEFLEAHTLTPDQAADPRVVAHIAVRLRKFHSLDMSHAVEAAAAAAAASGAAASAAAPAAAAAACSTLDPSSPATSQWDNLDAWLDMAQGLSFPHDGAKQAAFAAVDFAALRTELAALRAVCGRVGSPRVFCHNDLLPGNMLVVRRAKAGVEAGAAPEARAEAGVAALEAAEAAPGAEAEGEAEPGAKRQRLEAASASASAAAGGAEEGGEGAGAGAGPCVLADGELQFIDFEYSGYGYRGFDFGNHFNEYAGFDCDYTRFPSPERQKVFFRHYLQPGELRRLAEERIAAAAGAVAATAAEDEPAAAAGALAAAEEAVLDGLVAEACVFALLSHAYWGVWSYVQARYSPIDFDYLAYAKMRWAEYHRRKAEFFALVDAAFPQ
ncbi:hypothetical protein GPECTOR_21g654 [Gonium pectorale]|uniref:ethanolamine kinase n=1 Tax=Gonium pectorale TaxID=33097 RepID=A0A150GHW7_GONPE|nr:hypothetical protein GPECTOR_21g654 [Gonium pectorale]|eukprot:KXZ49428.1 hypothetical protein GPECTOR_21g654 [Gonium pectorale]